MKDPVVDAEKKIVIRMGAKRSKIYDFLLSAGQNVTKKDVDNIIQRERQAATSLDDDDETAFVLAEFASSDAGSVITVDETDRNETGVVSKYMRDLYTNADYDDEMQDMLRFTNLWVSKHVATEYSAALNKWKTYEYKDVDNEAAVTVVGRRSWTSSTVTVPQVPVFEYHSFASTSDELLDNREPVLTRAQRYKRALLFTNPIASEMAEYSDEETVEEMQAFLVAQWRNIRQRKRRRVSIADKAELSQANSLYDESIGSDVAYDPSAPTFPEVEGEDATQTDNSENLPPRAVVASTTNSDSDFEDSRLNNRLNPVAKKTCRPMLDKNKKAAEGPVLDKGEETLRDTYEKSVNPIGC
ncbi:hypothetical protein ATCC90586_000275 [Pythium insidiosum]|nr:hypothetical protein ATCC90586_000275 [Pythium insidiosum]